NIYGAQYHVYFVPRSALQQFSIHVITNDRISSLERLVTSLQSSHFLGDEVELSLHVDIDADEEMMDYI
ncbi:unnamed protein product, partial [Laminaria digitata]